MRGHQRAAWVLSCGARRGGRARTSTGGLGAELRGEEREDVRGHQRAAWVLSCL